MLGALAVLTAGAAHAELLEYTFKAPDGTQRSLTPNANSIMVSAARTRTA
ncbi:DUF4165 domain-containing protein [Escherichia coli]|nr:DUF4165 domain-containing protein [Escherichia coli]MDO2120431.1 DUF4165 domain-containing protein [Escherichia coli]